MKNTTSKKHDYSGILIAAAILVTTVRYAGAFLASDLGEISGKISEVLSIAMAFTGLGMGLLDVLGSAYIFDGWRRTMPKAGQHWPFRFYVLTGFVFSMFAAGVCILVPFTVSRVTHQAMEVVLGTGPLMWIWSLLVNVAPYILIGGVVTGNNSVVSISSGESSGQQGKVSGNFPVSGSELSGNFPADWRKARPYMPAEEVAEIARSSTAEIKAKYHLTDKTARNWRNYAQAEMVPATPGGEQ